MTRRLDKYNEGLDLQSELEQLFSTPMEEDDKFLSLLTERYMNYKVNYVKHLFFNADTQNMSKFNNHIFQTRYLCLDDSFPTVTMKHAPPESVHIYFDTATYDEIERDVKVTILTFSLSYQN